MSKNVLKIAVTGANGYVGGSIVKYLRKHKNLVYELRHDLKAVPSENVFQLPYSLEKTINPQLLNGIDVLIHCAYDFRYTKWKKIQNINVQGSINLFKAAKNQGVKKYILISTMAAFKGCRSLYGKAKLEIEKEVKTLGGVVIRPGLVYSNNSGGMVGRLNKIVSLLRLVPLVGTGEQKFYLTHEQDLCLLILNLCENYDKTSPFLIVAASEKHKTFRNVLEILAKEKRKEIFFLPIPTIFFIMVFKFIDCLNINFGFHYDSLISLINLDTNPNFGITRRIGISFREFKV